jgi:enamine deaminase RidA (YjgF/YER057c/UK114 family)
MSADQRIGSLGIQLPPESGPAGSYVTAVQAGTLLFVSGKAPLPIGGKMPKGRLGGEYSTEEGYALARSSCINLLATVKSALVHRHANNET